jgi:hypothetical protein
MRTIEVIHSTQVINVDPATQAVSVTNAGPVGPPGPQGLQGEPGLSGDDNLMLHVMDPTPHVAYDDMVSLSSLFANALA